jgi:hypothetical protein
VFIPTYTTKEQEIYKFSKPQNYQLNFYQYLHW